MMFLLFFKPAFLPEPVKQGNSFNTVFLSSMKRSHGKIDGDGDTDEKSSCSSNNEREAKALSACRLLLPTVPRLKTTHTEERCVEDSRHTSVLPVELWLLICESLHKPTIDARERWHFKLRVTMSQVSKFFHSFLKVSSTLFAGTLLFSIRSSKCTKTDFLLTSFNMECTKKLKQEFTQKCYAFESVHR